MTARTTGTGRRREDLLELLRGMQPLYAILDSARDGAILELLQGGADTYCSLYEGEDDELSEIAPYLVRLEPDSETLPALLAEGWGCRWGVFLTTRASLEEVRRHVRRFLVVEMPDGQAVCFRFYDPQVLCHFLWACNPAELETFFGPIERFLLEGEHPQRMAELVYRAGDVSFFSRRVCLDRSNRRKKAIHVSSP